MSSDPTDPAAGPSPGDAVHNVAELLKRTHCESFGGLSDHVDAYAGLESNGDIELAATAGSPTLEITVDRYFDILHFPFTLDRFWAVIDDLTERADARLRADCLPGEGDYDGGRQLLETLADFFEVSPPSLRRRSAEAGIPSRLETSSATTRHPPPGTPPENRRWWFSASARTAPAWSNP